MAQVGTRTRNVAAIVVAVLVVAALASALKGTSPTSAQVDHGTGTIEVVPFGDVPAVGATRASFIETSGRLARSGPLIAAGLMALGALAALALRSRASSGRRRGRMDLAPLRRLAGLRAPPLQLS
jgi:hypothetical protein